VIDGLSWNERKNLLTKDSSVRWAGSITRDNNDQLRLSRDNLVRTIDGWQKAIKTIEKRLAAPIPVKKNKGQEPVVSNSNLPADQNLSLNETPESDDQPKSKNKSRKQAVGYASQAERAFKQIRLAHLKSRVIEAQTELVSGDISICKGGHDLLNKRQHLAEAGLSLEQWQAQYQAERRFLTADGESQKKWGNETIRVSPEGSVVIKLPPSLVKLGLGNIGRGQKKTHYQLSTPVNFHYRAKEWLAQVQGNQAVSYTLREDPIKHKWYLSASWTQEPIQIYHTLDKPNILAVDTNANHFSARVIEPSGNPVGPAFTIPLPLGLMSSVYPLVSA
jgi:hypothetical protein